MDVIEVIVRGLLIKGNHLLVCQNKGKDYYYLPGGHVKFFEKTEAALMREWQEELACACNIEKFLKHFEDRFVVDGKRYHEYTFLYQVNCDVLDLQRPFPQKEAHLNFYWIPLNKLSDLKLYPDNLFDYIRSYFL